MSAHDRVRAMLWSFRQSCLAAAAVEVGLIARLAEGPADEAALAAELELLPRPLFRFLRALRALGMVEEEDGRYRLRDDGHALAGLAPFAHLIGAEYLPAWTRLSHSLRKPGTAFEEVFGMPVWQHREEHPDLNESLNRTMLAYQESQVDAILATCDFTDSRLLVDVGGSYGRLVLGILGRYPALRAVLFDQPHVVPGMGERIAAAGMQERCTPRGGDFFAEVPGGGDTYLLKHILHNWGDADATAILRTVRAAMGDGGRLVIVENIISDPAAGWTTDGHWNDFALDLHMMAVLGGEVRSLDQYDALFAAAGFARTATRSAQGLVDIIEAAPTERPDA